MDRIDYAIKKATESINQLNERQSWGGSTWVSGGGGTPEVELKILIQNVKVNICSSVHFDCDLTPS